MKWAAENFRFSLATWIENPEDTPLLRPAILSRRARKPGETFVSDAGKLRAIAHRVERGSPHEPLELARRGQHETARQFTAPVGFEVELRHQIVHRETMHPAQHALGKIARLARPIEFDTAHLHRLT